MMGGLDVAPAALSCVNCNRSGKRDIARRAWPQKSVVIKKSDWETFASPTSLCPVVRVLISRELPDQKLVFGSQGGTVYGSEAYAPMLGARTQSLALARAVVVASRASTSLPAAMAWVVKTAVISATDQNVTLVICFLHMVNDAQEAWLLHVKCGQLAPSKGTSLQEPSRTSEQRRLDPVTLRLDHVRFISRSCELIAAHAYPPIMQRREERADRDPCSSIARSRLATCRGGLTHRRHVTEEANFHASNKHEEL
jgi:hypothetical protein